MHLLLTCPSQHLKDLSLPSLSDWTVNACGKQTSLALSCADRALAAKHAQPPHSPTAGIALRMRDAAAAQAMVQVRRNIGMLPAGSTISCWYKT